MEKHLRAALLHGCLAMLLTTAVAAQSPQRPVGMNLSFIPDYSPQWMFVDAMKQCREWFVQENIDFPGFSADGIALPARSDGYPTKVPFTVGGKQYRVHTLLLRELLFGYPSGTYTVEFEGKGKLLLDFDVQRTELTQSGTQHTVTVSAGMNGIHLTILESQESDPVRNIRVVMPTFASTYRTQPFHPTFLAHLGGMNVLRYMSPQLTNLTEITSPDNRNKPNTYTQVLTPGGGLAWEHIAELSNASGTDPWVCVPVFANDSYVREFAKVLKAQLRPERKIYLEYGNEFWNSAYPFSTGHNYARQQGAAEKLSDDSFIGGLIWVTKRSVEIFSIFEEEFGGTSRLVRVLAAQAANSFTGQQMLKSLANPAVNPKGKKVDALAVAPYIGNEIADAVALRASSVTVDEILSMLDSLARTETPALVAANKRETDAAGVQLVAYESGHHLPSVRGANRDNTTLTGKLLAANRHQRMRDIYCRYYDAWYAGGGRLMNVFDYVSSYSKFGYWGQLEHLQQDTATAPKLSALKSCVIARNVMTSVNISNDGSEELSFRVTPHPIFEYMTILFELPRREYITLKLYNILGQELVSVADGVFDAGEHASSLSLLALALPRGAYFLRLQTPTFSQTKPVQVLR